MASSTNVGGGIADGADGSLGAGESAGLIESTVIDVSAIFEIVAEGAEIEKGQETTRVEFHGADAGEVSGGYAENGSSSAQMLEDLVDCREHRRVDLIAMAMNALAHQAADARELRAPGCFGNRGEGERIAQDADVGVAVSGDAIEIQIAAGENF